MDYPSPRIAFLLTEASLFFAFVVATRNQRRDADAGLLVDNHTNQNTQP